MRRSFLALIVALALMAALTASSFATLERHSQAASGAGSHHKSAMVAREWLTRQQTRRDADLEISVERVMPAVKRGNEFLLIDVRPPQAFARCRIPNSLNLPLYALHAKAFLQNQRLVLFDEGYAYRDLERECRRLRSAGFRAAILDGGLQRWKASGGAMEGDLRAQRELNRVPPQRFFKEKDYDHWLVVDVAPKPRRQAAAWIAQAQSLPWSGNARFFLKRFHHLLQRHPKRTQLQVLIVDRDGSGYETLERLMEPAGIHNLFYLEGGVEGYSRYLQQQATLSGGAAPQGPVRKCSNCP
jgi:rhodanese-related sulfurtransferase